MEKESEFLFTFLWVFKIILFIILLRKVIDTQQMICFKFQREPGTKLLMEIIE